MNMKLGEGIVEEIIDNKYASIKVSREQLFSACSSCIGVERVVVKARNLVQAKKGQAVRYYMPEGHLILGAFVCFILPLCLLFLGGLVGYYVSLLWGSPVFASIVAGTGISLALIFIIWRVCDRRISFLLNTEPCICEIIQD